MNNTTNYNNKNNTQLKNKNKKHTPQWFATNLSLEMDIVLLYNTLFASKYETWWEIIICGQRIFFRLSSSIKTNTNKKSSEIKCKQNPNFIWNREEFRWTWTQNQNQNRKSKSIEV